MQDLACMVMFLHCDLSPVQMLQNGSLEKSTWIMKHLHCEILIRQSEIFA